MNTKNPPRCKSRRRLNAVVVVQMMMAIRDGACTLHELVDLTGLSIMTVRSYILTLHREGGCYIEHWEQDRRGAWSTPAWRLGEKRDAAKPAPISNAVRGKLYRARRAQQQVLAALAGTAEMAA